MAWESVRKVVDQLQIHEKSPNSSEFSLPQADQIREDRALFTLIFASIPIFRAGLKIFSVIRQQNRSVPRSPQNVLLGAKSGRF